MVTVESHRHRRERLKSGLCNLMAVLTRKLRVSSLDDRALLTFNTTSSLSCISASVSRFILYYGLLALASDSLPAFCSLSFTDLWILKARIFTSQTHDSGHHKVATSTMIVSKQSTPCDSEVRRERDSRRPCE